MNLQILILWSFFHFHDIFFLEYTIDLLIIDEAVIRNTIFEGYLLV